MKMKVQLIIQTKSGSTATTEIATLERGESGRLPPAQQAGYKPAALSVGHHSEKALHIGRRPYKQQMRWTMIGAHRLLQVRARVLNQQLRGDFERWYPEPRTTTEPVSLAA